VNRDFLVVSDQPTGEPVLDPIHLARQTFDDRDLGRDLLRLLDEQCGRLLPAIANAGPARARADAAHTLKGAARAVGAWRLAAAADRFEAALDGGNGLDGRLADLDAAIREFRQAARAWLDAA
jgi:HPt (histidine-containing phosphotransfer) domain-containing protein